MNEAALLYGWNKVRRQLLHFLSLETGLRGANDSQLGWHTERACYPRVDRNVDGSCELFAG